MFKVTHKTKNNEDQILFVDSNLTEEEFKSFLEKMEMDLTKVSLEKINCLSTWTFRMYLKGLETSEPELFK